jgi:hypothetical protein
MQVRFDYRKESPGLLKAICSLRQYLHEGVSQASTSRRITPHPEP